MLFKGMKSSITSSPSILICDIAYWSNTNSSSSAKDFISIHQFLYWNSTFLNLIQFLRMNPRSISLQSLYRTKKKHNFLWSYFRLKRDQ